MLNQCNSPSVRVQIGAADVRRASLCLDGVAASVVFMIGAAWGCGWVSRAGKCAWPCRYGQAWRWSGTGYSSALSAPFHPP